MWFRVAVAEWRLCQDVSCLTINWHDHPDHSDISLELIVKINICREYPFRLEIAMFMIFQVILKLEINLNVTETSPTRHSICLVRFRSDWTDTWSALHERLCAVIYLMHLHLVFAPLSTSRHTMIRLCNRDSCLFTLTLFRFNFKVRRKTAWK